VLKIDENTTPEKTLIVKVKVGGTDADEYAAGLRLYKTLDSAINI